MTPVELLAAVGIPTLAVVAVCVVDHLRGRFVRNVDPLADLAKRMDRGVI